jgi:hypothetical protein
VTAASTNDILRRYHLTRLMEHRNDKEEVIAQKGRKTKRIKPNSTHLEDYGHANVLIEGCRRVSSMVLSSLMAEAYLELERSSRMRNVSGTEYKKRYI